MTDDLRSPKGANAPDPPKESQVHSLVDHNASAVTLGQAKKKAAKTSQAHRFWEKGLRLWPSSRQHKIIGSSIAVALIALGGVGVYALSRALEYKPGADTPIVIKQSKTEPSKLTGVEVPREVNDKRVIGIMIENSPDARPQAGLKDAGVVFEAIAEGGITRFHALFLESSPGYIGPVRSVRPYYADWSAGFDAAFAHAGGSGDGLARLAKLKMSDLDYTIAVNAYHRVSDRFAPHNLYTSIKALRKEMKRLKYARPSKFEGFKRKVESQKAAGKPARNINFAISGELYDVRFAYDSKKNNYKRYLGGLPHRDHKSGKQITPKVVVALVTSYSQNGIYSVYKTTGSGKIIVFQDGKATRGIWKKPSAKSSLQFFDSSGKPLRLNPGQTWITALKSTNEARY